MLLSDGYGNTRSWCKEHGELLPKGVAVTVPLQLGECAGAVGPPLEKLPPVLSGLPLKPGNIRPPLVNNDISKHSDVLELHVPTADHHESRPLVVPVKPQSTGINLLHVKPTPLHSNQANYRPPLQPFHLQGPPGAWNIVTSKPGSLPPPIHVYQSKVVPPVSNTQNTEGIELQFGPRLPLPPINPQPVHHFPPRRRPATKIEESSEPSIRDDLSTSDTETSVTVISSTEQQPAATERSDQVAEADIIVIETNDILSNTTADIEKPVNQSIKTDILSDDQLTIFKVGPDNDIVRVSNETKDNDTDTDTESDYKLVILHKLPNGNALNLENLKTYNYEDLIKGHSSVLEDSNQEEMERENLEFFDVPRRVSNDKPEPYIIYQIPDKTSHVKQSNGGGPVYRPSVQPVYRPTALAGPHAAQFNHTGAPNDTNINRPKVAIPSAASNDWIPTNRKNNAINLDKLTELSQLAQVSINNKGPIRVSSSPSSPSSPHPSKLNVQLLPSRLSAVLSQLDSEERQERQEREGRGQAGAPSHRQNKISPAFQPLLKTIRDRMYARKIHTGQYVVTQPYQTQVIPSTKHKYIPLLHQGGALWWQPHQQRYQVPLRPHQLVTRHHYSLASAPVTVQLANKTTSSVKFMGHFTNSTKLRAFLNKSQSVLLGYNYSAPVYVIDFNQTSQLHKNLSDQNPVHLNGTSEGRNFTEEITTEKFPQLSEINVKNEPTLDLLSMGNQKLNGSTRSQSVSRGSDEVSLISLTDQSGNYLQELSPESENTKLKSYPASGMVNNSQD